MRRRAHELEQLGIEVAVITFEAGFLARSYVEDTELNWPLLVDEDRGLYAGYRMLEASRWDLWGPKTWWAYGRELLRGGRLRSSQGDISQRGGDVLIDPEGLVRMHHVGDGPADRPGVEMILSVVRGAGWVPEALPPL